MWTPSHSIWILIVNGYIMHNEISNLIAHVMMLSFPLYTGCKPNLTLIISVNILLNRNAIAITSIQILWDNLGKDDFKCQCKCIMDYENITCKIIKTFLSAKWASWNQLYIRALKSKYLCRNSSDDCHSRPDNPKWKEAIVIIALFRTNFPFRTLKLLDWTAFSWFMLRCETVNKKIATIQTSGSTINRTIF